MDPQMQIDAVVWDMDGLIFDTEVLSFQAWQEGAKALGLHLDPELFQSLIGMNSAAIMQRLTNELGPSVDVQRLRTEAGAVYDALLANGPPLKKGAAECLKRLAELKVPQALATSSSYGYATEKLSHHDLLRLFQETVTGDQVENCKPHPEPYLLAAKRLNIAPKHCLAFEDSANGIHSAKQAGMQTVLIPDLCQHDENSLARVDYQFESLEAALPFLEGLFKR